MCDTHLLGLGVGGQPVWVESLVVGHGGGVWVWRGNVCNGHAGAVLGYIRAGSGAARK
jgi:hypothetical protein